MNINAISSFNNVAKAQSFKAAPKEEPCCCCGQNHDSEKEVTYASWGPNYIYPVTVEKSDKLASIAAEKATKEASPATNPNEPLSFEEMEAQRIRYLRD